MTIHKAFPQQEFYLASKKLNISKVTLHKYRKNGTIPFSTVGRNIRYDYQEVLKSLKKDL